MSSFPSVPRVEGIAAPLLRANVDTDAIIPSREIKGVGKTGLADGLFAAWRYTAPGSRDPDPDFVLNDPRYAYAPILLAGENFGCGSSREHAVWALHEYGVRAIIAPSFAPIFRGNCVRNGIVPVVLGEETVRTIAGADVPVVVDLIGEQVEAGGDIYKFEMDAEAKAMLVEGLDGIDVTMLNSAAIDQFHAADRTARPWIYLRQKP